MDTPDNNEVTDQNLRLIKAFSKIESSTIREQIIAFVSECESKGNVSSPQLGAPDIPVALHLVRSKKNDCHIEQLGNRKKPAIPSGTAGKV
jgi:hypothetical protein